MAASLLSNIDALGQLDLEEVWIEPGLGEGGLDQG